MKAIRQNMVLRYLMLASGLALFVMEEDFVAKWSNALYSMYAADGRTSPDNSTGGPDNPGSLPEQEEEAGQKKQANEKEEQSEKEEKKDKQNPFSGFHPLYDADAASRSATRFYNVSTSPESVVREVLAPPPERA